MARGKNRKELEKVAKISPNQPFSFRGFLRRESLGAGSRLSIREIISLARPDSRNRWGGKRTTSWTRQSFEHLALSSSKLWRRPGRRAGSRQAPQRTMLSVKGSGRPSFKEALEKHSKNLSSDGKRGPDTGARFQKNLKRYFEEFLPFSYWIFNI